MSVSHFVYVLRYQAHYTNRRKEGHFPVKAKKRGRWMYFQGISKKKVGESSLTGNEMQPKAVSICKNHLLGCFLNVSKYECNPFGNVCFAKPSHYWCVQKLSTFSPQLSRVSFLLWFCIEKGEKALPILPCTEIKSRLLRLFSSCFNLKQRELF